LTFHLSLSLSSRNALTVLLISSLTAAHPLTNTLECYFDEEKVVSISGYSCILTDVNVNITKQTQRILITGDHDEQHGNADVVNIKIFDSHTPFIVPEILAAFPNVEGLEIRRSSLKRIQSFVLSTAPGLKDVLIVDNNISVLEHGAFGLENLEHLLLVNNHIETIEEGAFFGLEKLQTLWLTHNRFTKLAPTTFGSLINLRKLFITHSYLGRIDAQLLFNSTQLQQLVLTDNRINEIESTFVDELANLEILKLKDNVCVDEDFVDVKEKINKNDLVEALDKCFDNFAIGGEEVRKETPETALQRVIFEIHGKFAIYSEGGDVIYAN
jgi:Leucine-rich repeat (LRR) protein